MQHFLAVSTVTQRIVLKCPEEPKRTQDAEKKEERKRVRVRDSPSAGGIYCY